MPPENPKSQQIDLDLALFLRMPKPVIFAAWGCYFVAMAGLIYGQVMADWFIACLILTAGLFVQI